MRFDYSHEHKPTDNELRRVEDFVNGWLAQGFGVERQTMSQHEAHELGAIGAFGEKYGATVSVYTITKRDTNDVLSLEFCGGPHVRSSEELVGRFRIVREQALSAGVRRIKAVLQ